MALQEGIYHAPGRRPGRHFALLFLRAAPGRGRGRRGGRARRPVGDVPGPEGRPRPRPRRRRAARRRARDDGPARLRAQRVRARRARRSRARTGSPTSTCFAPPTRPGAVRCCAARACEYAPDVRANMATEAFCVQVIAETKLAVDRAVVETWKALADARRAGARADDVLPRQPARRPPQLDRLPRRPVEPAQRGSRGGHRDRARAPTRAGPSAGRTSRSCASPSTSPAGGA